MLGKQKLIKEFSKQFEYKTNFFYQYFKDDISERKYNIYLRKNYWLIEILIEIVLYIYIIIASIHHYDLLVNKFSKILGSILIGGIVLLKLTQLKMDCNNKFYNFVIIIKFIITLIIFYGILFEIIFHQKSFYFTAFYTNFLLQILIVTVIYFFCLRHIWSGSTNANDAMNWPCTRSLGHSEYRRFEINVI